MMTAALVIIIILAIALLIRLYQKNTNAVCESKKRLDGKVAIVTGGTAGMGLEIATDLASRGAKVTIACPFEEEGLTARKTIVETTGNDKVIFKLLDLGSLKSVRKFATDILKSEERLDILIDNAGIGFPKDFITEDGLSFIMQVNYFGHFLLTVLLLPLLKKTGTRYEPSRVVTVSSVLHQIGIYDIRNMNKTDHWLMTQIYAKSKLCLVLFTRELTKKLKGSHVVINTVDPGAVGTKIFDSVGKLYGPVITFLANTLYKTPWEGAQTTLHVALDDKAGEVSGEFFKNCRKGRAIHWGYNPKLARIIWDKSVKFVKLSDDELKYLELV